MAKGCFRLIFLSALVAVLFFGLISIIMNAGGNFFYLELAGFLLLGFLALVGFVSTGNFSKKMFLFMFSLSLLNLILIWVVNSQLYFTLTIISLVGLFMSIPCNSCEKQTKEPKQVQNNVLFEKPTTNSQETVAAISSNEQTQKSVVSLEPKKPTAPKKKTQPKKAVTKKSVATSKPITKATKPAVKPVAKKTIKANHSPGKYVASKKSNLFHEPKCEWAAKIKEHRQLWFTTKEKADNKKYRPHSCVN